MPSIYQSDYVRQLFDDMSQSYAKVNYLSSFGFSKRWRRQFLKHLPDHHQELQILDLMTGMGETWEYLRPKFPNATISALDFSPKMLQYAQQKNQKQFNNTIQIIQQNALYNELPSESYDIIIAAFGLKTFDTEQLHLFAQQIYRLLKQGGTFSFIEISVPNNPLLRGLYTVYLKYAIPMLGKWLLGNPDNYRMLWQYTQQFGNARHLIPIFEQNGLQVCHHDYFGGCSSGVYGKK